MASGPPPIEEDTPYSTPRFRAAAVHRRRTPFSPSSPSHSWDSSSSSSFSFDESPPYSPTTPLKSQGVPFSWEQVPGIPKHRHFKNKEPSFTHLLPLPPARNHMRKLQNQDKISPKKHHMSCRDDDSDPFLTALVACSKDDERHHDLWRGATSSKVSRTLSDRFGFTSCRRSCAVSESVVYLPRPAPHYLVHRRP